MKTLGGSPYSTLSSVPKMVLYSGPGKVIPSTMFGVNGGGPNGYPSFNIINITNSVFTINSNNGRLAGCDSFQFTNSGGTLPSPLLANTLYWKVNSPTGATSTTFQVSATSGGSPITITDTGTGTTVVFMYSTLNGATNQYDLIRSYASAGAFWRQIHLSTSPDVFDFSYCDGWIPFHYNAGRKIIHTIYQTPSWATADTSSDAFGVVGGAGTPSSMAYLSAYVTAFLQRYNQVSPVNPTGAKMIFGLECWNEPGFNPQLTTGGYFNGPLTVAAAGSSTSAKTAAYSAMVQMVKTINQAAAAVDPTCRIVSPGFTAGNIAIPNSNNAAYSWLTTSDGASGTGASWITDFAIHLYSYEQRSGQLNILNSMTLLRNMLQAAGLPSNINIYNTEHGFIADPSCASNTDLANFLVRNYVVQAAAGFSALCLFQHGGYSLAPVGQQINPSTQPEVNQALINARSQLSGKTMTYCAINQDDTVTFTANGSTYTY